MISKNCKIKNCNRVKYCLGYCTRHYDNIIRYPKEQEKRKARQKLIYKNINKDSKYLENCRLKAKKYSKTDNCRYKVARRTAGYKNLSWNISFKKFKQIIKLPCIYCGNLVGTTGSGLDRINHNKGYTINNINPCCGICNRTRQNLYTVEEFKVMIKALLDYRKNS